MKIATEMENYIRKNQTGYASFSPKHFKLVEEALLSDEEVILPLLSSQSGNNEKAVVFTNKNMIVARKSLFDTYTIVVSLDQIISVTKDFRIYLREKYTLKRLIKDLGYTLKKR